MVGRGLEEEDRGQIRYGWWGLGEEDRGDEELKWFYLFLALYLGGTI